MTSQNSKYRCVKGMVTAILVYLVYDTLVTHFVYKGINAFRVADGADPIVPASSVLVTLVAVIPSALIGLVGGYFGGRLYAIAIGVVVCDLIGLQSSFLGFVIGCAIAASVGNDE